MTVESLPPLTDSGLIQAILGRMAQDLGMLMGHDLELNGLDVSRARTRPAGKDRIHISFKLGLTQDGGAKRFGALLVPLPEAITMAGFLLMMPLESLAPRRNDSALDSALKDALLEIGNMIGSASNTALASLGAAGFAMRSEGCQGVRPDVRPAFPYQEGAELVVGRATARFEPFPPFELILMLPPLA
jgi:hypothetical protein